jgi:hypothetical protein
MVYLLLKNLSYHHQQKENNMVIKTLKKKGSPAPTRPIVPPKDSK